MEETIRRGRIEFLLVDCCTKYLKAADNSQEQFAAEKQIEVLMKILDKSTEKINKLFCKCTISDYWSCDGDE